MHQSGPLPLIFEGLEQGFGGKKTAKMGAGENLDMRLNIFGIHLKKVNIRSNTNIFM